VVKLGHISGKGSGWHTYISGSPGRDEGQADCRMLDHFEAWEVLIVSAFVLIRNMARVLSRDLTSQWRPILL
jgi:hypothetical protein